jgi:hypothetical protein
MSPYEERGFSCFCGLAIQLKQLKQSGAFGEIEQKHLPATKRGGREEGRRMFTYPLARERINRSQSGKQRRHHGTIAVGRP